MTLKGVRPYEKRDADKYNKYRWWLGITYGDMLDKAADVYPNKEAVVDTAVRWTYAQLREKANRLAVSLMELGIKKYDRVIIQLPNWIEFTCTFFALQKIGAIVVLSIARHAQQEINHLCRITEAKAWIVPETYRKINYLPIIDDVIKANPKLKHVILVRSKANDKFIDLQTLIKNGDLSESKMSELAKRRPNPMDVAHMGATGGTTGIPKVAARTHNDYICRLEYMSRAWELTSDDIVLAAIPIGHDACFGILFLSAVFTFSKLIILDATTPEDILIAIQKERVTAMAAVPTLYRSLIDYDGLENYDVSSLKRVYAGGQASPSDTVQKVREKLGCIYINAYGGTEGMTTMTRLDHDPATVHTTQGKPTCPYDSYKIIGEKGRELPPNTVGELAIKGPGVFSGYYNAPAENRKVFTKDGFFKTGDLASIDELGNIKIAGRLKDIICRGGENISPYEIEGLIMKHPAVEAVAVVAMPDIVLEEKACAYIQLRSGEHLSFEGTISFLKSQGASVLQLPERVEFIESMPLINVGKIDKKALREDICKKIEQEGK